MSTGTTTPGTARTPDLARNDGHVRRYSNETKPAYKTTEFMVYIGITAALLIAALVTKAGNNGHDDRLTASQAWLYVAIVTFGYLLSRGLAKSGSRWRDDDR